MSYAGVGEYFSPQAMGSYYTFTPHEVFPTSGMGAYYYLQGFGSIAPDFSADVLWADKELGGSCYTPGTSNYAACQGIPTGPPNQSVCGQCNAAGARAVRMLQAGLSELAYGPITIDGKWGPQTESAWVKFLQDNGLTRPTGTGPALITKQGIVMMEKNLREGKATGSGTKTEFENVGGTLVPKESGVGLAKAKLGTVGLILAGLAVVGIGYAAYKSGQKKKGAAPPKQQTQMTAKR